MRPGVSHGMRASSPSPALAEVTSTGTPGATLSISPRRASTSAHRSALLSSTTGRAPLSQARTSALSIRRGLKSPSRPITRKTASTLAASTWATERSPGARRTKAVRRGSSASMTARCPASNGRRATQSPTVGRPEGPRASWRRRPVDGGDGLTLLRVHAQDPGVAGDHAARHQAPGGEGCEGLLEEALEAEPPECRPRQGVSRAAPGTRP